jgi:hypothetical protein
MSKETDGGAGDGASSASGCLGHLLRPSMPPNPPLQSDGRVGRYAPSPVRR